MTATPPLPPKKTKQKTKNKTKQKQTRKKEMNNNHVGKKDDTLMGLLV